MKFSMQQDVHPIYSLGGWVREDPKWKFTDKQGHQHTYGSNENPYPSLDKRTESEVKWSDIWDEQYEDETIWYECKICQEIVKPGTICDMGPIYQYGCTTYLIDDSPVP